MGRRYFVETALMETGPDGPMAELAGSEAHHLIHVMRARTGEVVTLWDGSGAEFDATVQEIGRSTARLRVHARRDVDREHPVPITLGVALPRGDRQRWLVEKVVELGVATLVPLTTTRGVAQPTGSAIERLQRAVIESSKQCGRTRRMKIHAPCDVTELASHAPLSADRIVAHPTPVPQPHGESRPGEARPGEADRWTGGESENSGLLLEESGRGAGPAAEIWLAVGPEGGFADEELRDLTVAGWRARQLGPRILRVETAAIALVAALVLAREHGG